MGIYLQNPNVNYPLHAHEAEEYYLILSGRGSWQVGNLWFDAVPGSVFHHQPSEPHRMITESEPLLGLWMWTGLIEGRYWFSSYEDVNCPFKLMSLSTPIMGSTEDRIQLKKRSTSW